MTCIEIGNKGFIQTMETKCLWQFIAFGYETTTTFPRRDVSMQLATILTPVEPPTRVIGSEKTAIF